MTWRVRDRATFSRFRTEGHWTKVGPLRMAHLRPRDTAEAESPPQVAFAIGRSVGHAVERNRLRRRLRAVFAEMERHNQVSGVYLVTAHAEATELSYQELREHVERALTRSENRVSRGSDNRLVP